MNATQTQQPEAMRPAEQLRDLSSMFKTPSLARGVCNSAIEELRRQNAEISSLTAELEKERTARQGAQLRIEELQAQLVRADAERCMAVAAEREACEERVVSLFEVLETPYLPDITRAIRARGTP